MGFPSLGSSSQRFEVPMSVTQLLFAEEFQALVVGLAIAEIFLGGACDLWFSCIQVFWAMKQIPDLLLFI